MTVESLTMVAFLILGIVCAVFVCRDDGDDDGYDGHGGCG